MDYIPGTRQERRGELQCADTMPAMSSYHRNRTPSRLPRPSIYIRERSCRILCNPYSFEWTVGLCILGFLGLRYQYGAAGIWTRGGGELAQEYISATESVDKVVAAYEGYITVVAHGFRSLLSRNTGELGLEDIHRLATHRTMLDLVENEVRG